MSFKIVQMKKKILFFLGATLHVYERRIAPFVAKYLWFLYWPFYKLFKRYGIVFFVNIPPGKGVGHIISELDQFFRRLETGEIPKRRYVWIAKPHDNARVCAKWYGAKIGRVYPSYFLYVLAYPLMVGFKDITLDCGLSRSKMQLCSKGLIDLGPKLCHTWLNVISKPESFVQWKNYYQLRQKTEGFFPLKVALSKGSLKPFLGEGIEKFAVIHIKDEVTNATPLPTDPKSYFPSLEWLKENGYAVVFAGRERMPKEFEQFGVLNYANSSLACFENDIQLFQLAKLAIIAGSGISFLADCFEIPYVYINFWHLPMHMFSSLGLAVPALVRKRDKYLSFKQQMDLYASLEDRHEELFPHKDYQGRNATGKEILEALKELAGYGKKIPPATPLQLQYRMLGRGFPLEDTQSRISQFFLQQHISLF